MFIPGEYNGDKEGYQYSTKGPKGEGYYKDFREQLRALGYSEDLIEVRQWVRQWARQWGGAGARGLEGEG